MNKGKVRDDVFTKRKHELVNKILKLIGKSPSSQIAKSLNKRSGTELVRIYRHEKSKRGIPLGFK